MDGSEIVERFRYSEDYICQWQTLNPEDIYTAFAGYDVIRFFDPIMDTMPRRPLAERYASFKARLAKRLPTGTNPHQ